MKPVVILSLWIVHFGLRVCLEKPLFYTGCLLTLYTGFTILELLQQDRVKRARTIKILDGP